MSCCNTDKKIKKNHIWFPRTYKALKVSAGYREGLTYLWETLLAHLHYMLTIYFKKQGKHNATSFIMVAIS